VVLGSREGFCLAIHRRTKRGRSQRGEAEPGVYVHPPPSSESETARMPRGEDPIIAERFKDLESVRNRLVLCKSAGEVSLSSALGT